MKTLLRHLALLTLILTPLAASFENTQRSLLPANTNPRAPRQGLVFDGTTGGTIANAATIGTADFTVAVWMNLRSTAGSQFILTNSIGTSNLQTSSADLVMYRSTGSTIATNTNPLVANKTQLIVYTRSGTTGQFYVNGVAFEGTKTDTNSYTTFSDIGGVGSASPLNGTLIPFIYNRALSATEVRALYESGAPAGADYNSASNTSLTIGTFSGANVSSASSTGFTYVLNGAGYAVSNYTFALSKGQRLRLTGTLTLNGGKTVLPQFYLDGTASPFATITSAGAFSVEVTCPTGPTNYIVAYANGDANYTISGLTVTRLGLLLAPDAAQAGAGTTWYDTSGNGANITWTSGVSWAVPSSSKTAGGWTFSGGINSAYINASGDSTINSTAAKTTQDTPLVLGTATGGLNDFQLTFFRSATGAGAYYSIQSVEQGIGYKNLALNKDGGNILLGTSSDSGQKLQVSGTGYFVDGTGAATIKARQLGSSFTSSAAVFEALTDNPNTGATNWALGTYRSGDNNYRHIVTIDGGTWWGSGSSSVDTNLYRSAAATLKTDHAFTVGGSLTVSANNALVTLNHQGGANTKSTIESNAGVSGNYNGMRLASNWTGSAQGNNGLPSWFVDFGGYDGITHGQDKFFVGRAPAGSTTVAKLFQVSGGGDVSVAGTTASTSTTTGALVVSGGVGVAGAINAGGPITSGASNNQLQFLGAIAVNSNQTIQIASGSFINGTYWLRATGTGNNDSVNFSVVAQRYAEPAYVVIHSQKNYGTALITNIRIERSTDTNTLYLVADIVAPVALTVTGGGSGVFPQVSLVAPAPTTSAFATVRTILSDYSGNASFAGDIKIGSGNASYSSAGRATVSLSGSSQGLLGFTINNVDKGYLLHEGTNVYLINDAAGRIIIGGGNSTGVTIKGTTANNNADDGYVGEYISGTLASGSATALTNSTAKTVTSISLTAGDWDVNGFVGYVPSAATVTVLYGGASTTNNTLGGETTYFQTPTSYSGLSTSIQTVFPSQRVSISSTTTVYLIARADFSAGTMSAFGQIKARRVR